MKIATIFQTIKRTLVVATTTAALAQTAWGVDSQSSLELWRSYTGVTWDVINSNAGTSMPFRNSANAPIAGIQFDGKGRAYVSTPRLIAADLPATLSILDTTAYSGPARLTAFPSESANSITADPKTSLRNVAGFYVDRRNGWLWALDIGSIAGESEAPAGAQKIVVYELDTGHVVKRIPLDTVADRKESFLNGIAVDESRKIAYISDSGQAGSTNRVVGIIVADFTTGNSHRVLHQHAALRPEPGVKVISHGEEVLPGNPLSIGINGIALSPNGSTLYWAVTSGTHTYSILTKILRNVTASEKQLSEAIQVVGNFGGNTDGMVTDSNGNLYIASLTHNGIVRFDSKKRNMTLLATDQNIYWPDTVTITHDGFLVFTSSQLNHHFMGTVKAGSEHYDLWRLRLVNGVSRN